MGGEIDMVNRQYLLTELYSIEFCIDNIVAYSLANLGLVENVYISDDNLHRLIIHHYEDVKARLHSASIELKVKSSPPASPQNYE